MGRSPAAKHNEDHEVRDEGQSHEQPADRAPPNAKSETGTDQNRKNEEEYERSETFHGRDG